MYEKKKYKTTDKNMSTLLKFTAVVHKRIYVMLKSGFLGNNCMKYAENEMKNQVDEKNNKN